MGSQVIVTGGCGFIGSHLVDELVKRGFFVTVIDDLSAGTDTRFLQQHIDTGAAEFIKYDVRDFDSLMQLDNEYEGIFHLAAQPDVKVSVNNPRVDFEVNVHGTFNILELMRLKDIKKLIFAGSGGTVYGEAEVHPTPETYALSPISNYGAAKAASEMYCSSYSSLYGLQITTLRLGNIFGPRSTHGVMYDFFNKLKSNPQKLQILGDGSQTKTYLYIEDTIRAIMLLYENLRAKYEAYNVSSSETISVNEIAKTIIETMELQNVLFEYTGGKRGWKGDVPYTSMDISKIQKLGWKPFVSIRDGIKRYVQWLQNN
ncbi:MAG: GDP-mannose 4,6-dehydratase [Candidatus Heimdallarchaeaceae archaeon]